MGDLSGRLIFGQGVRISKAVVDYEMGQPEVECAHIVP
jgi:hypothetical protein